MTEEGTISLIELVQLSTPEEETEGFQYLNGDCVPTPVEYATISPEVLILLSLSILVLLEALL